MKYTVNKVDMAAGIGEFPGGMENAFSVVYKTSLEERKLKGEQCK